MLRRAGANWRPTGERFVDLARAKLVDVYCDPETGEREYREQDGQR